jgi:DNA uptake protein ComE-like DNA-binding protein
VRPWTASQRVAVSVFLLVALSIGVGRWWRNRAYVSDPQPETPHLAADLADRIDPNTADAATLSALPLIGERRARDIIAYRESQQARRPGEPVFRELTDLVRVKGIGVATIKQLEPFLVFPKEDRPQMDTGDRR